MNNELARKARGEVSTKRGEKQVVADARDVIQGVQLAAIKADGALALGGHIMQGAVELDKLRQQLSKGDTAMNLLLSEIEATTISQAQSIQRSAFGNFG